MPANTPIYGFTYPCPGDVVDATAFSTLATQIDTKLASVQLDNNYAIGRYVVSDNILDQAGVVSAVETPLTNPGAAYVVPADGIYTVTARFRVTATTVNMVRLRVRRAGVAVFGRTLNSDAALATSQMCIVTGAVLMVAGGTIDMSVLFVGTGAGTVQSTRFSVRQVVRIL